MKNIFIRKILAGTAALALCGSVIIPAGAAETKGDADGNGIVNTADIVTLSNWILTGEGLTDAGKANADMNSDSQINVIDFILLKNTFVGEAASSALSIKLNGTEITADSGIAVEGTKVTISKSGDYIVTGEMTADAQIVVAASAEDKDSVNITLADVKMTNTTDTPCIMVENADKTKITFTGENKLVNTYDAADAASAVIYAKDDITFTKSSSGSLKIETNAQTGIYCNNDIKFNGGKIKIKTDSANSGISKADAVKAKGDIELAGGVLDINAAGDGLKSSKAAVTVSNGSAEIKAGNDAVQAETSFTMTGGNVTACGDRGLTAAGEVTVSDGKLFVTSTESFSFPAKTDTDGASIITLKEQHTKTEVITFCGTDFTPLKKYQYIMVFDRDLNANSNYENILVINGEAYDTSNGVIKESHTVR